MSGSRSGFAVRWFLIAPPSICSLFTITCSVIVASESILRFVIYCRIYSMGSSTQKVSFGAVLPIRSLRQLCSYSFSGWTRRGLQVFAER